MSASAERAGRSWSDFAFLKQIGAQHAAGRPDEYAHGLFVLPFPSRRQCWGRCKAVGVHRLGYSGGLSYKEAESGFNS